MFIDTHCHLTDEYEGGINAIIEHAKLSGVGAMICATADPKDIKHALDITQTYDNIFVTTGIHPDYIDTNPDEYLTNEVLNNLRVIGVGEIGLDYHYNPQSRTQQIELFEKQLDIAYKHNLPVAIHTREAEEDTAHILTNKYHGVMHCFTSS
ncbi:MAG: TatD family hydrolase, partial [Alphaproteobacteria bacterium]|nr:TatD family hydrolase [Alphaproteobacteria bacterium]